MKLSNVGKRNAMILENSGKPIYVQIAERIMEQQMLPTAAPHTRLASVREYAAANEVNANTVMRSYEMLENLGIIYNKRGIGFFTRDNAGELSRNYFGKSFYDNELPRIFNRMKSLGITPDEISSLYNKFLQQQ